MQWLVSSAVSIILTALGLAARYHGNLLGLPLLIGAGITTVSAIRKIHWHFGVKEGQHEYRNHTH